MNSLINSTNGTKTEEDDSLSYSSLNSYNDYNFDFLNIKNMNYFEIDPLSEYLKQPFYNLHSVVSQHIQECNELHLLKYFT